MNALNLFNNGNVSLNSLSFLNNTFTDMGIELFINLQEKFLRNYLPTF